MRIPKLLLLSLALSANSFAQEAKVIGTIDHTFTAPKNKAISAKPTIQHIKLLKIKLSKPAIDLLKNRMTVTVNKTNKASLMASNLPRKVELGMGNVPVLDQGNFGSCVTFANTAAVNAALNQGDYISQLCQLQLGTYLEKNGYNPSGWNGSYGRLVLNQMETFGIVSKEQQKTAGCGGLTEYPETEQSLSNPGMTPEEYHQLSEDLSQKTIRWSSILDLFQALLDRTDTDKTIHDIKVALNENDRVTFGVLLLDFDLGFAGAVGTRNATYDTWVLTPEIARDIYLRPLFGGHEMIITGYDDDAVATDEQGRQHKGLFTLRNSWGENVGDHGNFYMSYDYFKVLVNEAHRIRYLPNEDETPQS
ncbi:C1 family peptidase [Legionella fallonii]|uniref:Cysteine protease n=1 Tax=Legionella fallonii LLAP-10 TaxID=1212491 RepID=A0A098G7D7_9GAMM|nr:C1 family peptidase [Legionella fallonii]CEG57884.1 Cysteine protease [Legionella fallonii LLAP-10]